VLDECERAKRAAAWIGASMIDAHAHLVCEDSARYPQLAAGGTIKRAEPVATMTAEQLIEQMDRNAVRQAVIVQRGSVYGFDNSYVCDSAAQYPDRLAAVCAIDTDGADAGAAVHRWVRDHGAAGIRMMQLVRSEDSQWIGGPQALDAWAAAAELGVPVCAHFFPWNRGPGIARLIEVLRIFPKLMVVVDHLGAIRSEDGPPDHGVDALLEDLARFDGVTLKFTTIPLGRLHESGVDARPIIRRVADLFGVDRMLWGSDVTQSSGTYDHMVSLGRHAVSAFTPREQEQMLGQSAARIYALEGRASFVRAVTA